MAQFPLYKVETPTESASENLVTTECPNLKWPQLTGEVGKSIRCWCQIFSGFHTVKSLKIS